MIPLPHLHADGTRGVGTLDDAAASEIRIGKQYLVFIAISDYEQWTPLRSPVTDARDIRRILVSRYHVDEVRELYDHKATKAAIIRLFVELQERMTADDSLLVFYSGHGHLDRSSNTGFWIPVNAGTDIYEQRNWLPHTQLKGLIANLPASHVLVISDSCFAGDLMYATRSLSAALDNSYLKNAYSRVSRQVLTSGALEAVPDESTFAGQLKSVLRRNERPLLDALMLYDEVRLAVEDTIPLLGALSGTGHQEGASFLLFLDEDAVAAAGRERQEPLPLRPNLDSPGDAPTPAVSRVRGEFCGGLGFGWMIPVGPVHRLLRSGPTPSGQVCYRFSLAWGELSIGIAGGAVILAGAEGRPDSYDLLSCPVAARVGYATVFDSRVFLTAGLEAGAAINIAGSRTPGVSDVQTAKLYVAPSAGVGLRLFDRLRVAVQGRFMTVFFDDSELTGISPELVVDYAF